MFGTTHPRLPWHHWPMTAGPPPPPRRDLRSNLIAGGVALLIVLAILVVCGLSADMAGRP